MAPARNSDFGWMTNRLSHVPCSSSHPDGKAMVANPLWQDFARKHRLNKKA
jgi:hypothetical protein